MEREEIKQILGIIYSVYQPNLLPPMTKELLGVWHELLQDLPVQAVKASVAAWITTNKYPPTIADIRERVARPALDAIETPEQAWTRVYKAIGKYGRTEPDMARLELGEDLWAMVGRDWSYYCLLLESDMPNEKARFIRAYTAQMSRRKEQAQIAPKVLAALDSGRLRLEAGDD